jgi:hypothetical protein
MEKALAMEVVIELTFCMRSAAMFEKPLPIFTVRT